MILIQITSVRTCQFSAHFVVLESNRSQKTIFIDEMPWIDTGRSTFMEALVNFWNCRANRRYDIF